jgi:chaperonin GroEL
MNESQVTIVKDQTFKVIQSATNKMVDMIKPTYGPASNRVIISRFTHLVSPDDGVQIARDFQLKDPAENAVVRMIREVLIKTNDLVGDGTTGAAIILQGIINEVSRYAKVNGRKIELELKKGFKEIETYLRKSAIPIETKEDLKKVALVSFDDGEIATMVADLYFKLGKEAIITIDKSSTLDTYVEMTDGVRLKSGYISPYMITNAERMESVVEKPYILMTDYRLTETNDILPIMEKLSKENKKELIVICENMEQHALATAVINKLQGKFNLVSICAPKGNNAVLLEDLAMMLGAKLFSEVKGDKLEDAEIKDLGRAERFTCKRDESLIVGSKGSKPLLEASIKDLETSLKNEKNEDTKKEIAKRLALFTSSLAVIKVGAPTDNEQKSLKYKVEDVVNSVKVAYKNGVVCGSGLALLRSKTTSLILREALKMPYRQLCENMGVEEITDFKENEAKNIVTRKRGEFMEVGVVDPVDVLLAGVESAISIASLLVTTSGIIVEHPKENNNK